MHLLVVIPAYNRQALIAPTLSSVAAQTRPPDAVIVVDDGSTDGTSHVVEEWIERHPELHARLVRTANHGASAARNLGVTAMGEQMDAVAFLDSDDWWPDDFLHRASSALEANPGAVAASTDQEFHSIGEDGRKTRSLSEIGDNPWLWMIRNGAGVGSCTLFRLPAFRTAGGYPENVPTGHDTVLFGYIAQHGAWLHLPGKPTIMLRSPEPTGGNHHLYSRYPDHLIRWAKVFHQCWKAAPIRARFNMEGRKILSKRWRAAAVSAYGLNRPDEARLCLAQAFRLRPWSIQNLQVLRSWYRDASCTAQNVRPGVEKRSSVPKQEPHLPSGSRAL